MSDVTEVETAPAMSPENVDLLERFGAALGADAIIESVQSIGDLVVRVTSSSWRAAGKVCRDTLGFNYLSFVGAIDWMPAPVVGEGASDTSSPVQPTEQTYGAAGSAGRFQVFARVASTNVPRSGLTLKVDIADDSPSVDSWVSIYPGADWHERETWEMFGIGFDGHPSLRHLYLPAEFEGNPLRKDFPLLAREVKPWPGLVNVEPMPGEAVEEEAVEE